MALPGLAQEPTLVRRPTQLAGNDGKVVRVQGIYEIYTFATNERVRDSSLAQDRAVRVRLEGGMVVQLGIRPREERDRLNGREVRARGKLVMRPEDTPLDPSATGPQPTLLEVTEVLPYP